MLCPNVIIEYITNLPVVILFFYPKIEDRMLVKFSKNCYYTM